MAKCSSLPHLCVWTELTVWTQVTILKLCEVPQLYVDIKVGNFIDSCSDECIVSQREEILKLMRLVEPSVVDPDVRQDA